MSDIYTWNVSIEKPTSCSASFRETAVAIGDTIHADFTWINAKYNFTGDIYAIMYLYDPDNVMVDSYEENASSSGSKTLQFIVDMPGTWSARIDAYDGSGWVTDTATIGVAGPDMKIEPTSIFYDGPFVSGAMEVVCVIDVKNYGNASAPAHIELWEYPNTPSQYRLGYWDTLAVAPGETIQRNFEIFIPDKTSWPLGVKVWGIGESEPSW